MTAVQDKINAALERAEHMRKFYTPGDENAMIDALQEALAAAGAEPGQEGPLNLAEALHAAQEAAAGPLDRIPDVEVHAVGVIAVATDGSFIYPLSLMPANIADEAITGALAATLMTVASDLTSNAAAPQATVTVDGRHHPAQVDLTLSEPDPEPTERKDG